MGRGNRQCHVLRFLQRHGFRNHFSQNHMQAGNQEEGKRDCDAVGIDFARQALSHPGLEDSRDGRFAYPAQRQTGERDPKLDRIQDFIQPGV